MGNLEAPANKPTQDRAEKRFSASQEEFARKRLEALKDTMDTLKKEDSEILSFTMFGSMARGNPTLKSDIDGYLFIDVAHHECDENGQSRLEEIKREGGRETVFTKEVNAPYREKFNQLMKARSDMSFEQIDQGLKVRPISDEILKQHIEDIVEYERAKMQYETDLGKWYAAGPDKHGLALTAQQKQEPVAPEFVPVSTTLGGLFHLDVGGGIKGYRAKLIDDLAARGEEGGKAWERIIQSTEMLENYLSTNKDKRYPRTLAEAQAVYGREGDKTEI